MSSPDKSKLTAKQRLASMWRVAVMSHRIAPSVLYVRIVSAVLGSVLPIVTTYFAAQTTTQLARAYGGQAGAGQLAILYVLITALFGIITTAWASVERFTSQSARYKLSTVIEGQLIQQFLSLDFWRYDDKKTADLLDEARKFSNFFNYIFDALGSILTAAVGLVGSIIALLFVSWWLALLLVIAVVPDAIIQYRLSKARTTHWKGTIDARRKAYNIEFRLTQINHIAELRLYGLVRHLLDLRQLYRDKDGKAQVAIERSFIGKEFVASLVQAIAEVLALVYIALRIIAHAQPIGQFLYVQQMVSRGLSSMSQALSQFLNIDQDIVNLGAFDEFMSLPTQRVGQAALVSAPQCIALQKVSFHYPQTTQLVLRDISLTVNAGQHIAIVGENGAGKSTLVKLLLGLYRPTKGKVLIDTIPTTDINLDSWHAQLGMLQQSSGDYDFADARDNILYGDVSRPISEQRYQQAITDAEAKEFLDKMPKKDRTYITPWMESEDGTPGVQLSGGQWQRLALARNFYRDSPVIILDEPTSAIDALAEARIFNRLFDKKDKTIITISHRLSTVRRADRIYVIEHGRIVEQGTHAELIRKKGAYFTLFESQL